MNRFRICLEAKRNKVDCAETAGRQNWQILTSSQQSVKEKTDVLRSLRNVWWCSIGTLYLRHVRFPGCRSQWPRGLRRGSAAARLLRLWIRIPGEAWMSVCCECCVLSGRCLCDELITCPEIVGSNPTVGKDDCLL